MFLSQIPTQLPIRLSLLENNKKENLLQAKGYPSIGQPFGLLERSVLHGEFF